MICPKCQATVPDESLFCLRCGARLQIPAQRLPLNGGGTTPPAGAAPAPRRPAVPAAVTSTAVPVAPPGGKQPYTLAFKPLADERLRYRVARWLCEQAPAHPLSEVQEELMRGDFATFLALTREEAEAARQRIQGLGAHPALWRLSPATAADMLIPERAERKAKKAEWSTEKKAAVAGIVLLVFFVFGAVSAYRYFNATPVGPQPGTMPTIGGKP